MQELQQYIKSYFGISSEELTAVVNLFEAENLKKNKFYCKQKQLCDKLSFIKSGVIRVYAEKDDKEITQWLSTPGYMITDLGSLVFDQPARFNLQAITPVELYTINRENYRKIKEVAPSWDKLEKLFIAKCFITIEDRVFQQLSMSAEEKYDQLYQQNKEIFNQVPLQYIASMLGMTPETLSRIRKKKIS